MSRMAIMAAASAFAVACNAATVWHVAPGGDDGNNDGKCTLEKTGTYGVRVF